MRFSNEPCGVYVSLCGLVKRAIKPLLGSEFKNRSKLKTDYARFARPASSRPSPLVAAMEMNFRSNWHITKCFVLIVEICFRFWFCSFLFFLSSRLSAFYLLVGRRRKFQPISRRDRLRAADRTRT